MLVFENSHLAKQFSCPVEKIKDRKHINNAEFTRFVLMKKNKIKKKSRKTEKHE